MNWCLQAEPGGQGGFTNSIPPSHKRSDFKYDAEGMGRIFGLDLNSDTL